MIQGAIPGKSGVYASSEGYEFTVANPYTVWTTLDGKFHTAYGMTQDGSSFVAKYDASYIMRPGYEPNPQVSSQYDLLTAATASLSPGLITFPLQIPCVPVPKTSARHDSGILTISPTATIDTLHFKWMDTAGSNDYSGNGSRIGGSECIDLDGVYSDSYGSITISEQGSGDARVLVGSAVVEGKTYKMAGIRVWDRGVFQLTTPGLSNVTGGGWLEWCPSKGFVSAMVGGKTRPSDKLRLYVQSDIRPLTASAVRVLNRVGD